MLSLIGYTHAVSGHRLDAQASLRNLQELAKKRYVSPYHVAIVYAGLGERGKALDRLEKAYEDREGRMTLPRVTPELDGFKAEPRFKQLLDRLSLE